MDNGSSKWVLCKYCTFFNRDDDGNTSCGDVGNGIGKSVTEYHRCHHFMLDVARVWQDGRDRSFEEWGETMVRVNRLRAENKRLKDRIAKLKDAPKNGEHAV